MEPVTGVNLKQLNVAQALVRCLEREGVKYVFGVPGEETQELLFAMEDSTQITFVPTRHENGAAFMANVWGRLTGKAGVCLATLGPGATNLVTGVADAQLDKAPLVAITGQGGLDRLHHESHQYVDIVSMYQPITKWNTAITAPESVAEVVRKAFKVAESEKPGATHIELAEDMARRKIDKDIFVLRPLRVRRPAPDYKALNATLELMKKAHRPLIIAGNGAVRKLASKHLTLLAERYRIPVASTFMGKGSLSDRSPQSLLAIGMGLRDYVIRAVEQADLIITVGYDIAEYAPEKWNPNADKRIIHIDFDPAEVYYHYSPEVEVVGDISASLWELNRNLATEKLEFDPEWYAPIRNKILADIQSYDLHEGDPFTIPGVLNIIRKVLAPEGLVISDVGSHKMWIARNFPTYVPNGVIISNGLASMGIALPGAVAASLVEPERQVVAIMGDGGFLMNSQELETAKRLGVGFTCLIFNDNEYGLIAWKQMAAAGRIAGTKLGNPDFKAYAESFGLPAYRPNSPEELEETLRHTLEENELAVVEVPVDPAVNLELAKKLEAYWKGVKL